MGRIPWLRHHYATVYHPKQQKMGTRGSSLDSRDPTSQPPPYLPRTRSVTAFNGLEKIDMFVWKELGRELGCGHGQAVPRAASNLLSDLFVLHDGGQTTEAIVQLGRSLHPHTREKSRSLHTSTCFLCIHI